VNEDTLIAVCAYAGDAHQVINALPLYLHHECPVVVFSPTNSPADVRYPGVEREFIGAAAYIGELSLMRQIWNLQALLRHPQNYFLLHDSDSFCLSPAIPWELYTLSEKTIWSNEITEPRPHASPYPKLAFQPPYFLSRRVIEQMLSVADNFTNHPITPYIDWAMNCWSAEAGLSHRSFSALEHTPYTENPCVSDDPWETLRYRIRYMGATMMHPIKTPEQIKLCTEAYAKKS